MKESYTQRLDQVDVIRYDGTNAAEVAAAFGGTVDENGSPVLALYGEGSAVSIPIGNYVYGMPFGDLKSLDPETFAMMWRLTSSMPAIAIIRSGSAPVPSSFLAGTTRSVEVTLNGSMPSADYAAVAGIDQTTSTPLGAVQVVGIAPGRTTSKVTVLVRNTGATAIASPAANVTVIATAPPA